MHIYRKTTVVPTLTLNIFDFVDLNQEVEDTLIFHQVPGTEQNQPYERQRRQVVTQLSSTSQHSVHCRNRLDGCQIPLW